MKNRKNQFRSHMNLPGLPAVSSCKGFPSSASSSCSSASKLETMNWPEWMDSLCLTSAILARQEKFETRDRWSVTVLAPRLLSLLSIAVLVSVQSVAHRARMSPEFLRIYPSLQNSKYKTLFLVRNSPAWSQWTAGRERPLYITLQQWEIRKFSQQFSRARRKGGQCTVGQQGAEEQGYGLWNRAKPQASCKNQGYT